MAKLTIDPDRLGGAAIDKSISGIMNGFMTGINKVFGSFQKLSKEQWDSLRNNMLMMGNKFKSGQKVLGDNLKYLEEQAKTNEKAAKLLEHYKKGVSVLGIIEKIENKIKPSKAEMQKLTEAYKESENLSEVLFNLTIKKSEKLREIVNSIGETSNLSVKSQTEFANQAIEALKAFGLDKNKKILTGSGITPEKGESISEAIEKAVKLGQLDAVKIIMENAAKMSAKGKKDEVKVSASELGKLGLGIKKGEYKEKVSSKEERSMISQPAGISTGISSVSSLLDQSAEILLLLAIILPFMWSFLDKQVSELISKIPGFGDKTPEQIKKEQAGMTNKELEDISTKGLFGVDMGKSGSIRNKIMSNVSTYSPEAVAAQNLLFQRDKDSKRASRAVMSKDLEVNSAFSTIQQEVKEAKDLAQQQSFNQAFPEVKDTSSSNDTSQPATPKTTGCTDGSRDAMCNALAGRNSKGN